MHLRDRDDYRKEGDFLGGGECDRIRSYILINYVKFEMLVRHIGTNV